MITDEKLKKICLVAMILGLAGMIAIGALIKPETLKVSQITQSKIGSIIEAQGTIASYSINKDNHIFFDLADGTGSISTVMFERTARGQKDVYNLKNGDNVTVTGKIALYQQELEIQADSITIV